ncbi:putative sodium-coupled neutral amino acid transporter 11 [Anneissia japonica]|uniref:putative sodium-coupled neutral amino acid transporter 11 n=1 Tax=Anneissia japonica TaxID=1529436 RepID=UPI001425B80A|nr:putative sodium-coupled neutral amino acid transporter 11 [Anneissia japonica]
MDSTKEATERTHIVDKSEPLNGAINTSDKVELIEDGALEEEEKQSSVTGASFNTANSILGSGIIGIPYAMMKSGLPFGIILLILVAGITDYSLVLLIKGGHLSGRDTYQGLVEVAFGRFGYYFLTVIQFLYPFIAMISYNVIIGDTITAVFIRVFDEEHVLANRYFVISLVTVFITLPISLYQNVAKLVKISIASLVLVFFIMVVVIIRYTSLDLPSTPDPWVFAKITFPESIGIMAFAFICHHNSFLLYTSLEDPTVDKWSTVTHLAVLISFVPCAIFGIFGYATFTGNTQGDILENYCYDDDLANAARLVFAITIMCTFPLECFVCREVLENFCVHQRWVEEPQPYTRHLIFTLVVAGLVLGFSMSTACLGIVLSLNGILCAIPLVFILPTLSYIKLESGSLLSKQKIPALIIAIFGCLVFICGVVILVVNSGEGRCETVVDLSYCNASDLITTSTFTQKLTTIGSTVATSIGPT